MRGVTPGVGDVIAARTDDAGWRRVLPHGETSGRALAHVPDSGTTDARTCTQVNEKFWTGRFRSGDFAPTVSVEA